LSYGLALLGCSEAFSPPVITADAAFTRCIVPRRGHAIGDGSVTGAVGKVLERK